MSDVILEVKNLKKYFQTPKGTLHAVDDVSFSIEKGKSTTGRCILRLLEPTAGEILFEGEDLRKLKLGKMRRKRRELQMIFQDPFSSLDPRKTVNQIISEPIKANRLMRSKYDLENRVLEIMETVGLAERLINVYPHELDGGRRQRIGIARALAMSPKFIVCDEPVSALDVSIQAQILNLLKDLQEQMGLTYIFITHDLSVVNYFADDIAVMYLGQMVEKAPAAELFDNPLHPYTKALLSAIPIPEIGRKPQRILLKGDIASPIDPKDECRFGSRCNCAFDPCGICSPKLKEVSPGHFVACHSCG